jgi:hypothetical protein
MTKGYFFELCFHVFKFIHEMFRREAVFFFQVGPIVIRQSTNVLDNGTTYCVARDLPKRTRLNCCSIQDHNYCCMYLSFSFFFL